MNGLQGIISRHKLVSDLIRDEGLRLKPYLDTVNKITIGVGRNLTDVGISKDEAMALLDHDIDNVLTRLATAFPWWPVLNEERKRVLANMAFNLGVEKLLTFHQMLAAVANEDYGKAADAMMDSLWAHQVGERAGRLAGIMRSGQEL